MKDKILAIKHKINSMSETQLYIAIVIFLSIITLVIFIKVNPSPTSSVKGTTVGPIPSVTITPSPTDVPLPSPTDIPVFQTQEPIIINSITPTQTSTPTQSPSPTNT